MEDDHGSSGGRGREAAAVLGMFMMSASVIYLADGSRIFFSVRIRLHPLKGKTDRDRTHNKIPDIL